MKFTALVHPEGDDEGTELLDHNARSAPQNWHEYILTVWMWRLIWFVCFLLVGRLFCLWTVFVTRGELTAEYHLDARLNPPRGGNEELFDVVLFANNVPDTYIVHTVEAVRACKHVGVVFVAWEKPSRPPSKLTEIAHNKFLLVHLDASTKPTVFDSLSALAPRTTSRGVFLLQSSVHPPSCPAITTAFLSWLESPSILSGLSPRLTQPKSPNLDSTREALIHNVYSSVLTSSTFVSKAQLNEFLAHHALHDLVRSQPQCLDLAINSFVTNQTNLPPKCLTSTGWVDPLAPPDFNTNRGACVRELTALFGRFPFLYSQGWVQSVFSTVVHPNH